MRFQDPRVETITAVIFDLYGVSADGDGITDLELDATESALTAPLPQSFRTFLRYFGALPNAPRCLFGLPRHRTWGDIVLMNCLDNPVCPRRYVKFAEERGQMFFFDTGAMDERGECPVAMRSADCRMVSVAEDFADFLCCFEMEAAE